MRAALIAAAVVLVVIVAVCVAVVVYVLRAERESRIVARERLLMRPGAGYPRHRRLPDLDVVGALRRVWVPLVLLGLGLVAVIWRGWP